MLQNNNKKMILIMIVIPKAVETDQILFGKLAII